MNWQACRINFSHAYELVLRQKAFAEHVITGAAPERQVQFLLK
jgi:hypothetical protein